MHKSMPLLIAALLLVPALAFAGKKVTAGDQSLQITSKVSPAKAGKSIAIKLGVDYESLNDGAQIKENTKSVTLHLAPGVKIHTANRTQCVYSKLADPDTGGPSACPAGSQIGTGNATADARPAAADPIAVDVTVFNGLDDTNPDGTPRSPAVPAILLYASGVKIALPFDIKSSAVELDYAPPTADETQLFHLQKVNLTFPKTAKKPYFTAPKTCHKKWKTSMTITNYDGPTVTASDSQKCHK